MSSARRTLEELSSESQHQVSALLSPLRDLTTSVVEATTTTLSLGEQGRGDVSPTDSVDADMNEHVVRASTLDTPAPSSIANAPVERNEGDKETPSTLSFFGKIGSVVDGLVERLEAGIGHLLDDAFTPHVSPQKQSSKQSASESPGSSNEEYERSKSALLYDPATYLSNPVDVFSCDPEALERYETFSKEFRVVDFARAMARIFATDTQLRKVYNGVGRIFVRHF